MENIADKINPADLRVLLIDLDDTLYPHDTGVWEMIKARMQQYMLEEMGFSPEETPPLRERLWKQYGTTLRGLQVEYEVDMAAYLAYVHDVPAESRLSPDPELAYMLDSFSQRKFIFTNASAAHARRIMDCLEVAAQFDGIIDIYAMAPHCKPQTQAFHKALTLVNEPPEACLLVDDSPDNLNAARSLGMATVSIGRHHHDGSVHIDSILELEELLG
jgi:putative hydrolase of the HAD superfamily